MSTLDGLPEDIICYIASKLHTSDNMCLRLVCRTLSRLVARFALSNLVIRLDTQNDLATKEKIKAYARGATEGTEWARTLKIPCLAHLRFEKEQHEMEETPQMLIQREHELREDLSAALARLDLHTFRWYTYSRDPDWAFEVFSRYLTAHPVRKLFLDFSGGLSATNFVLDGIGCLQELTVTNVCRTVDPQTDELVMAISKIIQRSPGLTRLIIHSGCWLLSPTFRMPTFHQILTGSPPLTLKTLDLRSVHIIMDDITTPYFRSLDSLIIRYEYVNPDSEIRAELEELWKTLRREQIKLRSVEVDINMVSEELLRYLEYCSGTLTDLLFCDDEFSGQEGPLQIGNLPTVFYRQTLPQLADHLEGLHIRTMDANEWCFGEDNAREIGKCTKLEKLAVSIVDLRQNHSISVRTLLDEAVAKLPAHLELVTFNVHQIPQIA